MAYQDRDERTPQDTREREAAPTGSNLALLASRTTNAFVRLVGVALVLVGLWAGVKVVFEAWGLYQQPAAIDRLARVLDHASHVDSLLVSRPPAASEGGGKAGASATQQAPEEPFRLSYFLAWTLAILLLLLIGKLATWTVRAGGELAISRGPSRRDA